jgi:hypothetical protein
MEINHIEHDNIIFIVGVLQVFWLMVQTTQL